MKTQGLHDPNTSPIPPLHLIKSALHHWLDHYDHDRRYQGTFVFQWCPSEQRWAHSGEVGTSKSFLLEGWVYNDVCVAPNQRDLNKKPLESRL